MKNPSRPSPDQPAKIELDVETLADLDVDDHDADRVKGGLTTRCPKGGDGGGTVIVA